MELLPHVSPPPGITMEQLEFDVMIWLLQEVQLAHQMVQYAYRMEQINMKEGLKFAPVVAGHQCAP